ncbi:MAG: hypothetical protein R3300_18235 [Candidatus Promineifilaceae bacterium]|nr:hypothetical protein [Candidatus Promineifilaceae bacterium]
MAGSSKDAPQRALQQIIESAQALGVEIDEEEALQWLAAMAAVDHQQLDLEVDQEQGVFGHRVVLLDFDPTDLDRLRRVAAIVEIEDRPDVETAIALSGSSAQSQVQSFPGDFDYFERVNIKADSRGEACTILGDVIREKALQAARGQGYQLIEVRYGTLRDEVIRGGKTLTPGASITWSPAEVEDGHFEVLTPEGDPMTIDWGYACQEPGWCKLDWVLVDPGQPRAVKASNMLDVTWEGPDGTLVPLDGFIDPYYQEVYLDAASIPLFSKISQQMDPNALRDYVSHLEHEIDKYTQEAYANYGKAAKRMYNVFRLTGRYEAAAYVRELFDEPAALLYQVSALLDGLADLGEDSAIDRETLVEQVDDLIRSVTSAAEGPVETELVMALLRVRDDLSGRRSLGSAWESTLREMQGNINGLVNDYFEERLRAIPQVNAYLESLATGE